MECPPPPGLPSTPPYIVVDRIQDVRAQRARIDGGEDEPEGCDGAAHGGALQVPAAARGGRGVCSRVSGSALPGSRHFPAVRSPRSERWVWGDPGGSDLRTGKQEAHARCLGVTQGQGPWLAWLLKQGPCAHPTQAGHLSRTPPSSPSPHLKRGVSCTTVATPAGEGAHRAQGQGCVPLSASQVPPAVAPCDNSCT